MTSLRTSHRSRSSRYGLAGAGLATLMATGLLVPSAAVANDADVIRHGGCSGASSWKLKASPDNGRIEVEGEVDSNRAGQTWHWQIRHDGNVSASGTAQTSGASGSFQRRRVLVNTAGTDQIGWRAHNRATGETCRGSLRF